MAAEAIDWQGKARELAGRIPPNRFHPAVLEWLETQPDRSPRLTVACSGGPDSLLLLLLVWAHWPEWRPGLAVLHFDHRLRGEASRGDARFVCEVADALGATVRVGEWEKAPGEKMTEAGARAARMAFFRQALKEEGRQALFVGHQRDDIVETQLMRLSRGSGTSGLAAPRPVQLFAGGRVHLRPLLAIGAAEIRRHLSDAGAPFRTDASNDGLDHYRNRLRLEVLPVWQKHAPFAVAAGAAASRELLQEDDDALRTLLRRIVPAAEPGAGYDLGRLAGQPRALLRRALQEWLSVEGLSENISKAAFETFLGALEEGRSCKMSGGSGIVIRLDERRRLSKVAKKQAAGRLFSSPWPLPLHSSILLPGGRSLSARLRIIDQALRRRILAGEVASRCTAFCAVGDQVQLRVRNWLPGDRFRPMGAPGSRKLQDIFVDRKICEEERYLLPVVVRGEEIIWIPQLPPAETARIDTATNQVVQLTYDWGRAV